MLFQVSDVSFEASCGFRFSLFVPFIMYPEKRKRPFGRILRQLGAIPFDKQKKQWTFHFGYVMIKKAKEFFAVRVLGNSFFKMGEGSY